MKAFTFFAAEIAVSVSHIEPLSVQSLDENPEETVEKGPKNGFASMQMAGALLPFRATMSGQNIWRTLTLVCLLVPGGLGFELPVLARQVPLEADSQNSDDPLEKEAPVQLPAAKPAAWEDSETRRLGTKSGYSDSDRAALAFGIALVLGAVIGIRKLAPRIAAFLNAQHDPWVSMGVVANELSAKVMAEEQAFATFTEAFKSGPSGQIHTPVFEPAVAAANPAGKAANPAGKAADASNPVSGSVNEFLRAAPGELAALRSLFGDVARAADDAAKKQVLAQLCAEITAFKDRSGVPELLPAWQVASAVEGLLKQLSETKASVTASALRTAASAVDLLEDLCVPGVNPALAIEPPIRLLAVDDDLISRQAVSMALKKALQQPDLANDGEAGLSLAETNAYDAIFLDVEMPGMDGFELCTKIRQTNLNQNTPVVFVTSHTDFETRAKSTITGARDIIGKPFMAFEIAVKALTLALRSRLENAPAAAVPKPVQARQLPSPPPKATASAPKVPTATAVVPKPVQARELSPPPPKSTVSVPSVAVATAATLLAPKKLPPAAKGPSSREYAKAVFKHVPGHLSEHRLRLRDLIASPDPAAIQDLLGDLYISIRGLHAEAERGELRTVQKLVLGLEGLVKKLFEKPALGSQSALNAAAEALELIEQLCREELNPSLSEPPVRLLVVDDDPIARRAISGALQLTFGRPETADSGEAALAQAQEQPFDLVFMDVMMPGMDGFAACAKIHETGQKTPVIFVTSQADALALAQAKAAGGCGFIPKPVLASEILLTALTHVLRGRLAQPEQPQLVLAHKEGH